MFNGNYVLTGEIEVLTGLHIGGSNNSIEIGGSDNVIIRDGVTNLPYIPGSSLKGKIRSLLELNDDEAYENVKKHDGEPSNTGLIAEVFGKAADKSDYNINNTEVDVIEKIKELEEKIKQLEEGNILKQENSIYSEENQEESKLDKQAGDKLVKLIVRDAYPTNETITEWEKNFEIVNGSELKYENSINRINGEANPRNIERVPPKSKFSFEIIFGIYNDNNEEYAREVYKLLNKGLKLLEDNYLGGSGSRGSGRVKINNTKLTLRDKKYYEDDDADEIEPEWGIKK